MPDTRLTEAPQATHDGDLAQRDDAQAKGAGRRLPKIVSGRASVVRAGLVVDGYHVDIAEMSSLGVWSRGSAGPHCPGLPRECRLHFGQSDQRADWYLYAAPILTAGDR